MADAISAWSAVWGAIGLIAILICTYEWLPVALKRLRHRAKFKGGTKPYFGALSDEYRDTDYAADLFREFFGEVRVAWSAHAGWRMQPFSGRFHTIDEDGFRVTPPPDNADPDNSNAVKIACYGGSTILGMGARDAGTVPAFLWQRLGPDAVVTNRGQLAHTLTQEVATLCEDLRQGRVPDVAVFFDGLNDVMTAEHAGRDGAVWQETNRHAEFNLLQPYRASDLRRYSLRAWLPRTTAALGLGDRPTDDAALLSGTDVNAVADAIVERYFNNLRIVEALAETWGFRAVFCWQPVITAKRHLTAYEQTFAAKADTPVFRAVYGPGGTDGRFATDPRVSNHPNVVDLSAALAGVEEGVYYDEHHLSERGNARIAAALQDAIERTAP